MVSVIHRDCSLVSAQSISGRLGGSDGMKPRFVAVQGKHIICCISSVRSHQVVLWRLYSHYLSGHRSCWAGAESSVPLSLCLAGSYVVSHCVFCALGVSLTVFLLWELSEG